MSRSPQCQGHLNVKLIHAYLTENFLFEKYVFDFFLSTDKQVDH